jgi:5-(carboxyamino)imidazole ribonucleotide synthase
MNEQLMIPIGSTLGMIAGGQIGGFFTEAALRMGYKVAVWDPDINAPAKRIATQSFTGAFDNQALLTEFENSISGFSIEWENIPNELIEKLGKSVIGKPTSKSVALAQDRIKEKNFLTNNNFPVTEYLGIESVTELEKVSFGFPWIIKTATLGYDGHGQWYIGNKNDIEENSTLQFAKGSLVVEKVVEYQCEISVVVGMDDEHNMIAYPPTENIHEKGILKMSISPARISQQLQKDATKLASTVIKSMNDPGIFCVEMFLTNNNELIVNEIAPRPHNSGHHTMDAFSISQYEHQVRILAGLPLREPIMNSKSVLLNVLGEEFTNLTNKQSLSKILKNSDGKIYLYGKSEVRPGRKMGHIVFCGTSRKELIHQAEFCQSIMSEK